MLIIDLPNTLVTYKTFAPASREIALQALRALRATPLRVRYGFNVTRDTSNANENH